MKSSSSGYIAVTLIIFVAITIIITTAAAIIFSLNALSETRVQQGMAAYYLAESGLEKGIISYIRDPGYSGPEIINFANGSATVSLTGGTMTSTGRVGTSSRVVQAQIDYTDKLTINSWQEIWP